MLRLPLGLIGATESGPLTQTLATRRLRLWNGETGRPIRLPLPAAASFVAAGRDRTVRMIPSKPLALNSAAMTPADPLTGSWDQQGFLWVLATNPYAGRYQLAYWTGAGPLHTFPPAPGSPVTLSAPGSG